MTDKPTPTDAATPECLTCSDHGAVGNSGFDYKTAADFLSGKTVSDEALRKFVAASRGAHDARAALHAKMLSLRGELASREAEIALLKRSLLDAEADAAAPQPPTAPATQQAGEVRRAELVPGVMHCAKCKFQLNRVTLCVSDGNAYAGNNKTEPCPNGCGPLWPVTWEQEAKNCWKALEEMHERLMAAAAPQPSTTAQAADSVQEDAAREAITAARARLLDSDLSKLTERGAKAWAGVDAQGLRDGGASPSANAGEPRKVFLVATGEEHEGEATYTRYDDKPPPLCDSECLFAAPPTAQAEGRMPIETAPKDGSRILLHPAVEVADDWSKGHWNGEHECWIVGGSPSGVVHTAWHPLPAAPGPADGESNG